MHLADKILPRIIDSGPFYTLANAILVGLALAVALQDVIACAIDAAPREALEVVVADIQLGFVAVEAGAWVDTGVGGTAESR